MSSTSFGPIDRPRLSKSEKALGYETLPKYGRTHNNIVFTPVVSAPTVLYTNHKRRAYNIHTRYTVVAVVYWRSQLYYRHRVRNFLVMINSDVSKERAFEKKK